MTGADEVDAFDAQGWNRVQLRHGVSAVHRGSRHVLGVVLRDAR